MVLGVLTRSQLNHSNREDAGLQSQKVIQVHWTAATTALFFKPATDARKQGGGMELFVLFVPAWGNVQLPEHQTKTPCNSGLCWGELTIERSASGRDVGLVSSSRRNSFLKFVTLLFIYSRGLSVNGDSWEVCCFRRLAKVLLSVVCTDSAMHNKKKHGEGGLQGACVFQTQPSQTQVHKGSKQIRDTRVYVFNFCAALPKFDICLFFSGSRK